jgi:hypothetical protein
MLNIVSPYRNANQTTMIHCLFPVRIAVMLNTHTHTHTQQTEIVSIDGMLGNWNSYALLWEYTMLHLLWKTVW